MPDEVCFDGPRPSWYPPEDEELELRMVYYYQSDHLSIQGVSGMNWTGGDFYWHLYTTARELPKP